MLKMRKAECRDSRKSQAESSGGPKVAVFSPITEEYCEVYQSPTSEDFCIAKNKLLIYYNIKLGSGNFGIVYKAKYEGREVAVKVLKNDSEIIGAIRREFKIMTIRHKYIHSLLKIYPGKEPIIVSELRKGDLKNYLSKNKNRIEIRTMYLYCYQIAEGMNYLNTNGIIHRDLAARNVLVVDHEHVEVADFGLAREVKEGTHFFNDEVPWRWLAIESLTSMIFNNKTDIWAYGITAWEIFTHGLFPYRHIKNLRTYKQLDNLLKRGERLPTPETIPRSSFYPIFTCWLEDPKHRPSFEYLSAFFNDEATKCLSSQINSVSTLNPIEVEINSNSNTIDSEIDIIEVRQMENENNDIDTFNKPTHRNSNKADIPNLQQSTSSGNINLEDFEQHIGHIFTRSTVNRRSNISTDSGFCTDATNLLLPEEFIKNKQRLKVKAKQLEKIHEYIRDIEVATYVHDCQKAKVNQILFSDTVSGLYKFDMDDLHELETISGKSSSTVKKYLHISTGKAVAIKFVKSPYGSKEKINREQMKKLCSEVQVLRNMANSNYIVKFYGLGFNHTGYAMICMEVMDFSLKEFHEKIGVFSEELLGIVAVFLVNALEECSDNKIVLRDLNSMNVLINRTGEIKLCDFRLSSILEQATSSSPLKDDSLKCIYRIATVLFEMMQEPVGNRPWALPCQNLQKQTKTNHKIDEFTKKCTELNTSDYMELKMTEFYQQYVPIATLEKVVEIIDNLMI